MLFLPQVITAITAALLGAGLGGRFGTKRIYLVGLTAGLVSMMILLVSSFLTDDQSLAYGCCSSPPRASAQVSASPCPR